MAEPFPFTAIVGQSEMKQALLVAAVDPRIGGVLITGDRGTGKSTAVRGLAAILPPLRVVADCPYRCGPGDSPECCPHCSSAATRTLGTGPVPVVDLPLGATEDRVVGALDIEEALVHGRKRFEPGLLARANRGFLYVDEVNLLEDHLVDLLLDVAASGENIVEREGLSVRHPARFVLIGSGNPEEGELRPQLLDRFGLSVEVTSPDDIDLRVEAVKRRESFDRDANAFHATWAREQQRLARRIAAARKRLDAIEVTDMMRRAIAGLCIKLGTDGLRGELTLIRAARALAALEGDTAIAANHLRQAAPLALRHRLRRNPMDEAGSRIRVERALAEAWAA
ncbi:magnesium chelatase ATPase subunit I [Phreatobacter oligotrophus]|jgi:magnesium chelatase subunit I|uniref:magnesium chelatase ATPase subunit I n=1 Tax=Phreatobacter oligotrophus TaxID=1122261 RepID=UPI00235375A7|nr:magnesium chelatase ATPase subunit I [Phreatobacter oligotrophus]MBX9991776.1 magnesium chelatase ATPase subunit I [Phreatobacter oligotrophus]